jgi:ParB family chromosome partitioning protein
MDASAGSPAGAALDQAREAVLAQLPAESANLWPWCLAQDQDRLLSLLAFCMSRTVNGIVTKFEGKERAHHANALASALNLDVAKWFTPTAANFFNRVSRQVILDCLAAAGKPPTPETLKLKKGELAAFAESEVAGTGWLPDPMLLTQPKKEDE